MAKQSNLDTDDFLQKVPVLNNAKILIERTGYFKCSKIYHLCVEEQNKLHPIIRAEPSGIFAMGSFFHLFAKHPSFSMCVVNPSCNTEDEKNKSKNKILKKATTDSSSYSYLDDFKQSESNDELEMMLNDYDNDNHHHNNNQHNNNIDLNDINDDMPHNMYFFDDECNYSGFELIDNHNNHIKHNNHSSLFKKFKLNPKRKFLCKKRPIAITSQWIKVGNMSSPGLLWDRTIVTDAKNVTKAAVLYHNTSRLGELMNMEVILPQVNAQTLRKLTKIINDSCNLPKDCAGVIAEFVGVIFWPEKLPTYRTSNCHRLLNESNILLMKNRLPSWNSQINAYTLEFGGRALIPSVHNFQLVNAFNNIVLQLGKVKDNEFNLDFAFPLSPFQAFTICLSVIHRSFVWD